MKIKIILSRKAKQYSTFVSSSVDFGGSSPDDSIPISKMYFVNSKDIS